jgi:hypothetical protein
MKYRINIDNDCVCSASWSGKSSENINLDKIEFQQKYMNNEFFLENIVTDNETTTNDIDCGEGGDYIIANENITRIPFNLEFDSYLTKKNNSFSSTEAYKFIHDDGDDGDDKDFQLSLNIKTTDSNTYYYKFKHKVNKVEKCMSPKIIISPLSPIKKIKKKIKSLRKGFSCVPIK